MAETTIAEQEPPPLSPAERIVLAEAQLARLGLTVVDLAARRDGPGDAPMEVWDPDTHALWFFHAHPDQTRFPGEAGHFHTFLGAAGMPRGTEPLVLPEMAMAAVTQPEGKEHPVTHLSNRHRGRFGHIVGVSVDAAGKPIGLFTTNRWVTGELWYRAPDVARMIDRFRLNAAVTMAAPVNPDLSVINLWLAAVLGLLRRHIEELLVERDAAVMDWRRRRSRQHHVFDDRRLEVPSSRPVDFKTELAAFQSAK